MMEDNNRKNSRSVAVQNTLLKSPVKCENQDIELFDKERRNDEKIQSKKTELEPNLVGNKLNVALLVLLYSLQGIPVGISIAIGTYIQNSKISYVQQAKYSTVDLPFTLKLLWAPLVDAIYSKRIGKRKSWLIPVQILIGLSFLYVGTNINVWLAKDHPNITILTIVLFGVNLLSATQDIIIDGWALTLLRRENVGYASVCNTSGQALGIALGYVFFILLESEEFCNKWLRYTDKRGGVVTMEGYLCFWGILYIVASTCIAIFKKEKCDQSNTNNQTNVMQTYKLLWKIINLQTIKDFAVVMLAYEVAFTSIGSSLTNPKFMEYGVAKEYLALVDMSLIPVKIFIPIFISKYTIGPRPLRIIYRTVPYRLLLGVASAGLVYYTPYFTNDNSNSKSIYFFVIFEFYRVSRLMMSVIVFLGVQSFFSRISDPHIGGTYMSLLNTVWHLGMAIARIAALGMLNSLTFKRCSEDGTNTCRSKTEIMQCRKYDSGECITIVDGYFIEVSICTVCGIVWYLLQRKSLKRLQSRPIEEWQVDHNIRDETKICNLPDLVGPRLQVGSSDEPN